MFGSAGSELKSPSAGRRAYSLTAIDVLNKSIGLLEIVYLVVCLMCRDAGQTAILTEGCPLQNWWEFRFLPSKQG